MLITFGIVFLLTILPLGIRICYDAHGLLVNAILGPAKLTLYPMKKKEKTDPEEASGNIRQEEKMPKPPTPPKPEEPKDVVETRGGSIAEFRPFVKLALEFLGDFRRKLRIHNLYLRLILGGGDPYELAVNYGRAWAAMGNLLPQMDRLFLIKKRDVEVECDFTAPETKVIVQADITITLGRLLALAVVYGIRAVKEYLTMKNRKGGAVT